MDKRLLLPAIAMTAAAQTVSPANAEAEKELRARAEQFYQLELAKDFRHAEALVAEDSKDYFYNSGKPNLKGATVRNIEFTDNGTRATVHIDVKVELLAPGIGAQVFSAPSSSTWKLENGQWCWYFDQNNTMNTPFGKMKFAPTQSGASSLDITRGAASAASLQSLVSVDRQSVSLTAAAPDQTVTVSNGLPGAITLTLAGDSINGVAAHIDKTELKADEKALLHLKRTGSAKSSGAIVVSVSPLSIELKIDVTAE